MKKTLIAILALGCIAMAEEDPNIVEITSTSGSNFNTDWSTTLQSSGWEKGDSYVLTLYVTGGLGTGGVMKLDDSCYLVTQNGAQANVYFGLNSSNSNSFADGWNNNWTTGYDSESLTLTRTATTYPAASWTMNDAGSSSATRAWGNTWAITITGDSEQTIIEYMYNDANTRTDRFVLSKDFDLSKFSFTNTGAVLSGDGVLMVTKAVPEPATGSLSLLALAGLCARRRRK